MLGRFTSTLALCFVMLSLSGCAILEGKKKVPHAIFIDATKINEETYLESETGIKLEVFFFKKRLKKENSPTNKLLQQILGAQTNVSVNGYHVYRFCSKSTLTDKLYIHPSACHACFVVWCNETIVHMQVLPWNAASSIHIKFVGDDMYVQYSS